jgi:hypothetical protein
MSLLTQSSQDLTARELFLLLQHESRCPHHSRDPLPSNDALDDTLTINPYCITRKADDTPFHTRLLNNTKLNWDDGNFEKCSRTGRNDY